MTELYKNAGEHFAEESAVAEDTVSAISTPPGKGGICVIRISGNNSLSLIRKLFRFHGKHSDFEPRRMYAGEIVDPEDQTVVDSAMCVFMKAPSSYTGEDSAEIHCHGGTACSAKIMELTLKYGCRPANPGEFTRRAFLNGKMDLSQAQAVADIINAQTELGLRQAGLQLSGGLSDKINKLKTQLLELLAEIEARIDFPEEETGETGPAKMEKTAEKISKDLESLLSTYAAGHLIREGTNIAIVGKPNAGKSSLMNALLGKQRAITSPEPGTTRDYIEEQTSINGINVRLTDTAGVRRAQSEAERTGIAMSREKAFGADLQILVVDGSVTLSGKDTKMIETSPVNTVLAVNKSDLNKAGIKTVRNRFPMKKSVSTSAKTGEGVEILKETIGRILMENMPPVESNEAVLTGIRQKTAVEKAYDSTQMFINLLKRKESPEILSIKIKEAMDMLGEITGETTTEELLGAIFSKFCIGK